MVQVNTKRFGKLQVNEEEVVSFVSPILGFSENEQFILILEEERGAFQFLQSTEDENLTFIIVDPFLFISDYEFHLSESWLEKLQIVGNEQIDVRVIVTVRSKNDITCNLRAPIVFNKLNRLAAQVILDQGEYSTRHSLIPSREGD
ncbi:flagellar assembly protein FliW [Paenibacillus glucanolyticus]